MASISMNPAFNDRATMMMMNTFRHGHQLAIVKGVVVFLTILAVGIFTMVMPMVGPASDAARSVVTESRSNADMHEP